MQALGPTIRYQCPLECGWHHDAPPPTPDDNPNQYTQAPDETIHDTITRMAGDTALLHRQAVDRALLEHLETHTIPQFVAKLAEQRGENARLRQVIAHLMTNPLDTRAHVCWTSDIDGQTGHVDITDAPDAGGDGRTIIRITEQ